MYREGTFSETFEKSKFIGHAKPVSSKEEALEYLKGIREKYKDATHNVPAIITGHTMEYQWSSEDGEPQGTAGAPVLRMMKEEGLTNLIVVVTRYFGGIKLGPGGLIRAYLAVAKGAIEDSKIASVSLREKATVKLEYQYFHKLAALSFLTDEGGNPLFITGDAKYEEEVIVPLTYNPENRGKIQNILGDLTQGAFEVLSLEKEEVKEMSGKY